MRCGLVSFFSLFVLSFVVHARDEKITDVFGSRGRFDFGDRSSFLDLAIERNGIETKRNETRAAWVERGKIAAMGKWKIIAGKDGRRAENWRNGERVNLSGPSTYERWAGGARGMQFKVNIIPSANHR